MKATISLYDTDEAEAEITIRMKLKDWKKLRAKLDAPPNDLSYPQLNLSRVIRTLVAKAEESYESKTRTDGGA